MARALARQAASRRTGPTPLLVSGLALVVVVGAAVSVGSVRVAPGALLGALLDGLRGHPVGTVDTIVWQLRLPRVALAA
ncbi:MAG: iron ABC transporter permease, partial [Deinococcales bacterium]